MKIVKAWWFDRRRIAVEFSADMHTLPAIRIECPNVRDLPKYSVYRVPKMRFGEANGYYIDGGRMVFVLDLDNFPNAPLRGDETFHVCGAFNNWTVGADEWRLNHLMGGIYTLSIPLEKLGLNRHKNGVFKFAYGARNSWLEPRESAPNFVRDEHGNANLAFSLQKTGENVFAVEFEKNCPIIDGLKVCEDGFGICADVDLARLLCSAYSASELGVVRSGEGTRFSVFAPRAKTACVVYKFDGEQNEHFLEASRDADGVWSAVSGKNLEGALYSWYVDGDNSDGSLAFSGRTPIADPYARSLPDSGSGRAIVKFPDTLPVYDGAFATPKWHDLVIVEAHLRDVLKNAEAALTDGERLTFDGLAKWLESPECYLRQTRANCVELQPIQEFTAANPADYEWGYMPVNWFSPSSSYASDARAGTQNADFARLVGAFHGAGLAVVLDVVYNHVGEPNYMMGLDKEYYFRLSNSHLLNFSGCGNDFKCDSAMAKRMIIDSLKEMIVRYGVDGFRFDLAELIGVDVLRDIERELKAVKRDVILIAEPWSFRGHIASALKRTGYASWNDGFREFMLKYVLNSGDFEGFKYFVSGSRAIAAWPAQTVNYLESHDDKCLLDRISANGRAPSIEDIRRYKMGYALVMLSSGIPMASEGFDILRTKGGLNNTYKNGDANALDYVRGRYHFAATRWLRNLVSFRLGADAKALRLENPPADSFYAFARAANSNASCVMFNADFSLGGARRIFAAFNPAGFETQIDAEKTGFDAEKFVRIADIDLFDVRGIDSPAPERGATVKIEALSLGVWLEKL